MAAMSVEEAQKKLNEILFYRPIRFRGKVFRYDDFVYSVRFSTLDGRELRTEDVPRKHFDDPDPKKKQLPEFWERLIAEIIDQMKTTEG